MRTMILWVTILLSMAISGFLQAAAEEQWQAERARIVEWQKKRDEWLESDEGKAYVLWLCSLSGEERERALKNAAKDYLILAPEEVTTEAGGYRRLECAKQRTSALGYTWSNQRLSSYIWSNRSLSGFTWSDERRSGYTWSKRRGVVRHA